MGLDGREAVSLPGDGLHDGTHEAGPVLQSARVVADVDDEHLVRADRGGTAREVAEHLEDESGLAGAGQPDDLEPLRLWLVEERAHQLRLGSLVAVEPSELVTGYVEAGELLDCGDRGEHAVTGDLLEHHTLGLGS